MPYVRGRRTQSPTGMDERCLYLDFDGVLHPDSVYVTPKRGVHLPFDLEHAGHTLFEHARLLEELLEPYPTVRIVLSTSWVRHHGFSRTANRLPVGLRERVVGATYHAHMERLEFDSLDRGMQVWADVLRRKPRVWLAVDDTDEGWPKDSRVNLVLTHPTYGIGHAPTRVELVDRLKRFGR